MRYKNGFLVLPRELLYEVQKYVQGEFVYIPKIKDRASWGSINGTRCNLDKRNKEMSFLYKKGYNIREIASKYHSAEDTVRKTLRKLGSGGKMTVRILKENEIDEVMRIWLDSTIEAHDFIPREYWEKNYYLVKEAYIPNSETFVYEDNDVIKGFVSIIDKEFIAAVFVDLCYQGKGIGKELISYVKTRFNGLALNVYKENEKAIKFYESQGFSIIEEQTEESTGKQDLLMKME